MIFPDEIAWFETPCPDFLAALYSCWDQFCSKRNDLLLIICGPAPWWMIEKVISNRGRRHNRIATHIHLLPLVLKETSGFRHMQQVPLTVKDVVQFCMAAGGIPCYLKW